MSGLAPMNNRTWLPLKKSGPDKMKDEAPRELLLEQCVRNHKRVREIPPKVLAVVPAYNEERYLQVAMNRLIRLFKRVKCSFKIAIAEEGSKDDTYTIAKGYMNKFPNLIDVFHRRTRVGRGFSVKEVWLTENADVYLYVDCDLPFSDSDILKVINYVAEGYDLVTGSRYIRGANVRRPFLREMISRLYNLLVRILLRSRVNDHQCGLKAASRKLVELVLPLTKEKHWSWDTEILILAQTNGYKVLEVPISWLEKKHKRTPVRRTLNDLINQGIWLLRFLVKAPIDHRGWFIKSVL